MPKRSFRQNLWLGVSIYAALFVVLLIIINRTKLGAWADSVVALFRPILIGLVLAYLLNPLFRFFERKLLYRLRPMGLRRGIALTLTYLSLIAILALLLALVIPSLYDSIMKFIGNYDEYVTSAVHTVNRTLERVDAFLYGIGIEQNFIKYLDIESVRHTLSFSFFNYEKVLETFGALLRDGSLVGVVSAIVGVAADVLFAFFVSLYLLTTKELRYAQIMRLRRAMFSDRVNSYITRVCTVADRSFGGFLEGKVVDSLIIGLLTYAAVLIFRIPYPELIATIVGVTNILPFFGPIIGAIPTSVIVLLTQPSKVIMLLILILIIQQIDGNIIGPKILGNNTGVSSLCVLIAISVMGSIAGFLGMLLGVPLFATVLVLLEEHMTERLRARGLSSSTENYYPADSVIDPNDSQERSDKLVRRMEKRYLRCLLTEQNGETLSKRDRFFKKTYRFGRKLRLLPALSDTVLVQFRLEESAREIVRRAKERE